MRTYLLTCFLILTNCTLFAQKNDTWTSFNNKDTTLTGFKDKNGIVKIAPKFVGLTHAGKFDNIIAVSERAGEKWNSYYLTKAGRIVGRDSLFIFDNTADCESEGFIRFTDRKTDRTGMFNSHGDVAIPAKYSALSGVNNGMVMALIDAEKEVLDDEDFSWKGGTQMLIDTNNNVLLDYFFYTTDLNFSSLRISDKEDPDPNRENFWGNKKKYYSFISYEKEFNNWLQDSLLKNLTNESLMDATFKEVYIWKDNGKDNDGWGVVNKANFIKDNFDLIKRKLTSEANNPDGYQVTDEELNPFIYESADFKQYFNNCGDAKELMYPVKSILINSIGENQWQDHFDFLRTENGYKLISISLGKDKLKY